MELHRGIAPELQHSFSHNKLGNEHRKQQKRQEKWAMKTKKKCDEGRESRKKCRLVRWTSYVCNTHFSLPKQLSPKFFSIFTMAREHQYSYSLEYMYWVTCLSNGKVEKYPNEYNSVKWIMAAPFGNNFFHCRVRVWMCMYLILHSFHTLSLFNTRSHNQPFVRSIHTITERTDIYDCVWFIWSLCISLYPLILLTYGLVCWCVCTFGICIRLFKCMNDGWICIMAFTWWCRMYACH